MALARLLAAWAGTWGVTLTALTVDHRLREGAAAEAEQVRDWLAAHGIAHVTLAWEEGAGLRGLAKSAQSAARDARYDLMTAWCAANGRTHLFVAHHADDQVETFLLRLSRGSGLSGLAAMAPSSVRGDIIIARPLLGFAKAELEATCRELDQSWIEDPSNQNDASGRVRFRKARALLEREGLTQQRLLATIGHLQRARAALDHAVTALLARGIWDEFGVFRLAIIDLLQAPEEIGLRALARVLAAASGQVYGPRFENLQKLYVRLGAGPWADATLHGCLVSRDGDDVVIGREVAQIIDEKTLAGDATILWDGRFKITLKTRMPGPFKISAFPSGIARCDMTDQEKGLLQTLPARVRATLPALTDVSGLAAVPHAGYVREDLAAAGGFSLEVACVSATFSTVSVGDAEK